MAMWFRRESNRNRRLHRHNVLDVKLRSDQVRASRLRLGTLLFLAVAGPFFGLYLLWRIGEVVLDAFVYHNSDFSIQQVEVQTDGVIAPEQLRRWAGIKPGANLVGLNLARVKSNLENIPAIAVVSVERVLPHTLKIRVSEREPVAQIAAPGAGGAWFQLSADGVVMPPLDPRLCTAPATPVNQPLPVITGFGALPLPAGQRLEQPQLLAALQLITAFDRSPMAGLADLRRLDVAAPGVIVVTTGQGGQITFSLDNMEGQLRRWRETYDLGMRQQKAIATLDLAVRNNVPATWMPAGSTPAAAAPKAVKPIKNRRKNV